MTKPLVPHTPTIDIDYDKYGHCVFCHRYLIIERIIDGKIVEVNHPDYYEEEFLLNDGSRMRVAICRPCHSKITDKDHKDIMASVIKGWVTEVQYLKNWTEKRRKDYIDRYSKKTILFVSKGLSADVVDRKFKKYMKGRK